MPVLANFPTVQKDELLGSLCARFVHRLHITDDKTALELLFSSHTIVPSSLLQGHIQELLSNIGHLWDTCPREIINNHSLLPLLSPFISKHRYLQLTEDLIKTSTNLSMSRAGINASTLKWPDTYKVCPLCVKAQKINLGFTYWQRIFQCAGIETCPEHLCELIDTKIPFTSAHRHKFVQPSYYAEAFKLTNSASIKQQAISQFIKDLLDCKYPQVSIYQWSQLYRYIAQSTDMMNGNRINHSRIKNQILLFWSPEWLTLHGMSLDHEDNWLLAIFRKHRKAFSYLQHITIWLALSPNNLSIPEIFNLAKSFPNKKIKKYSYEQCKNDKKLESYRNDWTKIRQSNSKLSLKIIRKTKQGAQLYSWLYRYDNHWLNQNKPNTIKSYVNNRVDWQKRDLFIIKQLIRINNSLIYNFKGPRRSRAWFCNQVNIKSLVDSHLNKLELCRKFFIKYAESIDEYQTRRVVNVMFELIQKNNNGMPVCEIEKRSGLSIQRSRAVTRQILKLDIPTWQSFKKFPY